MRHGRTTVQRLARHPAGAARLERPTGQAVQVKACFVGRQVELAPLSAGTRGRRSRDALRPLAPRRGAAFALIRRRRRTPPGLCFKHRDVGRRHVIDLGARPRRSALLCGPQPHFCGGRALLAPQQGSLEVAGRGERDHFRRGRRRGIFVLTDHVEHEDQQRDHALRRWDHQRCVAEGGTEGHPELVRCDPSLDCVDELD